MPVVAIYRLDNGRVFQMAESPVVQPSPDPGVYGVLVVDNSTNLDPNLWSVDITSDPPVLVSRELSLDENKAAKYRAASIYFSRLFLAPNGFTFEGHLYQIDQMSEMRIYRHGLEAAKSISDPSTFPWDNTFYFITATNASIFMDAETMRDFDQTVTDYIRLCRYRVRVIKDTINAAVNQTVLDAIDITVGYPASTNEV